MPGDCRETDCLVDADGLLCCRVPAAYTAGFYASFRFDAISPPQQKTGKSCMLADDLTKRCRVDDGGLFSPELLISGGVVMIAGTSGLIPEGGAHILIS